jgi:hypothetical protein
MSAEIRSRRVANTPRVERTERLEGSQTSPRRLAPLQAAGLTISPVPYENSLPDVAPRFVL